MRRNRVLDNHHSLLADEDCCHPHSAPDAHGRDEHFSAGLLGDVETSCDLTGTSYGRKIRALVI
jgi:hypothetical protein